jgi:hypothetical protein
MAMEAALVYPLVAHWLMGAGERAPLGPLAARVMLPFGYLAARYSPVRGVPVHRAEFGAAVAFGLRLLATLPVLVALSLGPLAGLAEWLVTAILPALVGWGLWWRGGALADAELTADGVRDEFLIAGGVLLVALGLFRDLAVISPLTSALAVVAYLTSGLLAVGLARQEQAGLAPNAASGSVVAVATALLLLASVGLVALLSPELADVVLGLVGQALGALLWLVTLPFVWLLSLLHLRLPLSTDLPLPPPPQAPAEPPDRPQPPEWVLQAVAILISVLGVVGILVVAAALAWLLLTLLQRTAFQPGVRAPVAVEADGTPWQDAQGLVAGLRGLLARLAGGARAAALRPGGPRQVRDARAAYRALLRWARARGVVRAVAETPAEFAHRLAVHVPDGTPHYALLTASYEQARYGGEAVPEPQVVRLRESLEALEALPVDRPS